MPAILNTHTTVSQINIATQKATVKAKYQTLITGVESDLKDLDSFLLNR